MMQNRGRLVIWAIVRAALLAAMISPVLAGAPQRGKAQDPSQQEHQVKPEEKPAPAEPSEATNAQDEPEATAVEADDPVSPPESDPAEQVTTTPEPDKPTAPAGTGPAAMTGRPPSVRRSPPARWRVVAAPTTDAACSDDRGG